MFRLLRFYSVASFVIILAAAAILTLFYRQATIHWAEFLAESGNLTLAQTILNSVQPEFNAYLKKNDGTGRGERRQRPLAGVAADISRMTHGTSVDSVKIYDLNGKVLFSTQANQIGKGADRDPGFLSASAGRIFSSVTVGDAFNHLNLMHTYIPIRNGPTEPILGVLEIHTDINRLINASDRILLYIPAGAVLILALLYAALFFVVRHAKNVIEAQQGTLQERMTSLKILSRQLLESEEFKNKKIAIDLHEGLAQTLSAIKVYVESSKGSRKEAGAQPQESIVPVLQSAIREVRTIATELWPSSLDDLGLLPTINWFCREFESHHPQIRIRREISLPERMVPPSLKIVIYRIIESSFNNIAKHSNTSQIRFILHHADDMIHLIVGDTPVEQPSTTAVARLDPTSDPHVRFAEVKERTKLSGGSFSTTLEYSGGVTLHASWACAGQPRA
jgi:signal transduction histidine kinase